MHNVFSNLPLAGLISLHPNVPTNTINRESLDGIEFFILKHIYICDLPDFRLTYSPEKFRNYIRQSIKDKSSLEIADFALSICKHYIDRLPNSTEGFSKIFPYDNIHAVRPSRKIEEFYEYIDYKEELVDFLLLSYFYIGSHTLLIRDLKNATINEILYNLGSEAGLKLEIYTRKGALHKTRSPFIEAFLYSAWDTVSSSKKSPAIDIQSPLDYDIMKCILSSSANSKNPFAVHEDNPPDNINIPLFLKNCTGYIMDTKQETDVIKRLKERMDSSVIKYYNENTFYIYDQYLMERLSCINLIYNISFLHKRGFLHTPIEKELFPNFMMLPLVDYRLKLLNFIKENDIRFDTQEETVEWEKKLNKLLSYQVKCLLPTIDLVFHYLMAIKYLNDGEPSLNDINNYFQKKSLINKNLFFSRKDAVLKPTRIFDEIKYPQQTDVDRKFFREIYIKFFTNMICLKRSHMFSNSVLADYYHKSSDLFNAILDGQPIKPIVESANSNMEAKVVEVAAKN